MDRGTPIERGISKLSNGRFMVRPQIKNPKTGKYFDTTRTTKPGEKIDAARELLRDLERKCLNPGATADRLRFKEYARTVLDNRIAQGIIASPATVEKVDIMHDKHLVPMWGDTYLDAIKRTDVEAWLGELGKLVRAKETTPQSVNTRWRQFRMIMRQAAIAFDMRDPTAGLSGIPTSLHRTYTAEEPNTLLPEEVRPFFLAAAEVAPAHFAYLALGTLTGRRPCEMRPLRRRGPSADVDWQTGVMQIRRSQTLGEPMEVTKTKKDVLLYLPPDLLAILKAHADSLKGVRADSDLLFPPIRRMGEDSSGYMAPTALRKPLVAICKKAEIKKTLSPRFMRRAYQDLCRAAQVSNLVQTSMSGHATASMVALYSTVDAAEGRQALIRMSDIAGLKQAARLT